MTAILQLVRSFVRPASARSPSWRSWLVAVAAAAVLMGALDSTDHRATEGARSAGGQPQEPQRQEPQPVEQPQDPAAQSPRPAPPPADAPVLPPAPEPYVAPVLRGDLPGRFTQRDPIEGVWRLQGRVVTGLPAAVGSGFMIIGQRHVMVQLLAPGPKIDIPMMRTGTYTWARTDDLGTVRLTMLSGFFNKENGDVLLEPEGKVEMRQFERTAAALRVHQGPVDWLEFVRVE